MVQVWSTVDGGMDLVAEVAAPLGEVMASHRDTWVEDVACLGPDEVAGGLCLVFIGSGFPLATMIRDMEDPELCRTIYADGRVELHRCRYVLDASGAYDHTEVTEHVVWADVV